MTPPVATIEVGQWVRIKRGGVWHVGEVIKIGRSTAHVKVGDDFLGHHTFVEQLKVLRTTQPAGGCTKPEPAGIEVNEANKETRDGD